LNKDFILKFFRFGCIGGLTFLFDASCFWLLLKLIALPEAARAISVILAMTMSWLLNRTFTFGASGTRPGWLEWLKFLVSQLPGAGVNALASLLFLHYVMNNPWLAVACGSCAGLAVNFFMASKFVFRKAA
jgi:putative flippase GtrA